MRRAWLRGRRIVAIAAGLMGIAAAVSAAVIYLQLTHWGATPLTLPDEGTVVVVTPGAPLHQIATRLATEHILDRPRRFEHLARLRGVAGRIQAGEYRLTPPFTPDGLLALLVRGRVWHHTLTIPEGLTVAEIAARVEAAGIGTAADFLAACADPALLSRTAPDTPTVEGYLLPQTYQWQRPTTAAAFAQRMVAAMAQAWTPERAAAAAALHLDRHQTLTLASIVEKETGRPEERPIIAAVFLNRLRRKMRLQSDPTVIYGIAHFDGNLTRADLARDTPYNSYTRFGLPPTPICNPGVAAVDAVLHPATTDALYFVARGDGTHVFSATLAEHERMVDRYQRHRRRRSRKRGLTQTVVSP